MQTKHIVPLTFVLMDTLIHIAIVLEEETITPAQKGGAHHE